MTLSPNGLNANHIPLHLSEGPSAFGTLRGHVARSNPVWSNYVIDVEVLAVFQGPNAYITPSWYPTKSENGKAVPTWNYAVAHAYGTLRVIDDALWLRAHLEALTAHNESMFSQQWRVSDAPHDFIEKMITAVVGIEIEVTRLVGKWKVSQNQPSQNQSGVVQGLRSMISTDASEMAVLVEEKITR